MVTRRALQHPFSETFRGRRLEGFLFFQNTDAYILILLSLKRNIPTKVNGTNDYVIQAVIMEKV